MSLAANDGEQSGAAAVASDGPRCRADSWVRSAYGTTGETPSYAECAAPRADADKDQELALARQIALDAPRTFLAPGLEDARANDQRRASLKRVLAASARHNPVEGYVQGMHAIASAALLPWTAESDPPGEADEERAFHLLHFVVRHLLPGFFAPGFPGMLVEQGVLHALVQRLRPALYSHLLSMSTPLSMLPTTSWFLSLFQQEESLSAEEACELMDELCAGRLTPLQLVLATFILAEPALMVASEVGQVVTSLRTHGCRTGLVAVAASLAMPSEAELTRLRIREQARMTDSVRGHSERRALSGTLRQVASTTHFSHQTLRSMYTHFLAMSTHAGSRGGGAHASDVHAASEGTEPYITREVFADVFRLVAGPEASSLIDSHALRTIFHVADTEGDGRLHFAQLASVLLT